MKQITMVNVAIVMCLLSSAIDIVDGQYLRAFLWYLIVLYQIDLQKLHAEIAKRKQT